MSERGEEKMGNKGHRMEKRFFGLLARYGFRIETDPDWDMNYKIDAMIRGIGDQHFEDHGLAVQITTRDAPPGVKAQVAKLCALKRVNTLVFVILPSTFPWSSPRVGSDLRTVFREVWAKRTAGKKQAFWMRIDTGAMQIKPY